MACYIVSHFLHYIFDRVIFSHFDHTTGRLAEENLTASFLQVKVCTCQNCLTINDI